MKNKKVLIFAGTTEGRKLAEYLARSGVSVCASTATEYGKSLLPVEEKNLTVSYGRMDIENMCGYIAEMKPDYVIDATHPYAQEVTANIQEACLKCQKRYLRVVREPEDVQADVVYTGSVREAAEFLSHTEGNILVTTGSKELEQYTVIPGYKERIYARVLSVKESVEKCEKLCIKGRHLICMQGPFSTEMNQALLKEYGISWMVTKESGAYGGYHEKCEAAARLGVKLVVIGRPEEENGYTYGEIIKFLKEELNLQDERKVSIIGIGPGGVADYTEEARVLCREADVVIGARRMTESAAEEGQKVYVSYKPEEIFSYICTHPEYEKIAVVMSGDTGFYSGAAKLSEMLREEEELETRIVPGISSVSYFCARLGITWEDAALVSVHGRRENLLSVIRENVKTLVLTGSSQDIRDICTVMTKLGYGDLRVCIGLNLSYGDERILKGKAADYCSYEGGNLAVMYIENPEGGDAAVTHGLSDSSFVRGDVPMTKEEVRSVCLSKLRIHRDSVLYDVGAGTGSVAVEAALQAVKGHVYAVERKEEAVSLIYENCRKMKTDNITVVEGEAPEVLEALPAPDIVFIGGSGGNLEEILRTVLQKNPEVRVVISAVTLETLAEAIRCSGLIRKSEEEIVQISVAKARNIGNYHMMMGQNPVFLISFTCEMKGQKI